MLRKILGVRRSGGARRTRTRPHARPRRPHPTCAAGACGAATYVYPGVARLCVSRALGLDLAAPATLAELPPAASGCASRGALSAGHNAPDPPTGCVVCLDDFVPDVELVRRLACGHTFHSACLLQWLSLALRCPLCNAAVAPGRPERCQTALRRTRPVTLMRARDAVDPRARSVYEYVQHDTARFAQFAAKQDARADG